MQHTKRNIKDYYRILQVKKTSGEDEIKRSYRGLAMKYHPDKNPGDEIAAAVFTEINEAYEVLSDKEKRNAYNESLYYYAPQEVETPLEALEILVEKSIKLKNIAAASNPFHLNKDALAWSVQDLLPDHIFSSSYNDLFGEKEKLILNIVDCSQLLHYNQAKNLSVLLMKLAGDNVEIKNTIERMLHAQQKRYHWEKSKIWIAVTITILLCFIIYFITKRK